MTIELKNNYLWWNGPAWLQNYNVKFNKLPDNNNQDISTEVCAEEKIQLVTTIAITDTHELYIYLIYTHHEKN